MVPTGSDRFNDESEKRRMVWKRVVSGLSPTLPQRDLAHVGSEWPVNRPKLPAGGKIVCVITPVSEWPSWLQFLVFAPNAILNGVLWWWSPKTKKDWRRWGFAVAYLIAFYLVMYLVFHFR